MFVKICGITSEEDALLAVAMGADALGFVFAPSTRQISSSLAADIVKRLPAEILTIGVFRDEAPQRVVDIAHGSGLHGVQLHGHESPAQSRWVRERVRFLIQGFAAGDPTLRRAAEHGADAVLVDNPTPGSGEVFDWSLTEDVPDGSRLVIAGGLTADNVASAIARVRPWGVDVSTGVEESPGRKDPRKLRAFVAAAREAGAEYQGYEGEDVEPYDWQEEE